MSATPSNSRTSSAICFPWFTLAASALAVVVWFWPGSFEALAYQRAEILGGAWCRLLTGHWVHFSGSHLFWNLAVLLPAGMWLERRNPAALRWTLALSPLIIGLALLAFDPSLATYAGLSGVTSGVLVALAVHGLRTQPDARRWWLAMLTLFAVKIAVESFRGRPLNAALAAQTIHSVPLAHLVGAATGAAVVFWRRGK